jgi:hypothetical protein
MLIGELFIFSVGGSKVNQPNNSLTALLILIHREFIKAKFTDGSLRISIPKYDGYQKQKIDIE